MTTPFMTALLFFALVAAPSTATKDKHPPATAERTVPERVSFQMPRPEAEWLAAAIYMAEGAERASTPYGLGIRNQAAAHAAATNRLDREWAAWLAAGRPAPDFVAWIGATWAPCGGASVGDAGHLNENWIRNVRAIYRKEHP